MNDVVKILRDIGSFPKEAAVIDRRENYKVAVWRDAFTNENGPARLFHNDDVASLISEFPGSLSRREILTIQDDDERRQRRKILIASLMWGYGTRGMRYQNKITSYLGQLLQDQFALDYRIEVTHVALQQNSLDLAYESMAGIRGIRSPFFTKILYFLGKSDCPGSTYPLILDSIVGRSLAMLSGFHYMMRMKQYAPSDTSSSYVHYVQTMHSWASDLSIDADVLEYHLWHPPKDLEAVCQKHFAESDSSSA